MPKQESANIQGFQKPSWCLRVACVATILAGTIESSGQATTYLNVLAEQQKTLAIDFRIAKSTYCSNSDLRLESVVTITNVSGESVVLCKGCFHIGGTYIGKTVERLNRGKYSYDLTSLGFKRLRTENVSPDREPFITLAKGEGFEVELKTYLDNFGRRRTILPPGKYMLAQQIRTWTDFSELDAAIKSKWEQQGLSFWSNDLVTPATKLTIPRRLARQKCH
jgi:hypothetical protein